MIADVVIIGAGIVGACCARACAQAGLDTVLVDRGAVASGTTGAGEGNILVSDKEPGPELDLALLSRHLWAEMAGDLGDSFELDPKGGLVVAALGMVFALVIYSQLKNLPVHKSMLEISELIYETCKTYLVTQMKFIAILEGYVAERFPTPG